MNSIVIGTDGSPEACAAVSKGLDLAARVDARVTFVSVRDVISMLRHDDDRRIGAGVAALDDALAEAERRGLDADVENAEGDPGAEILRVARSRDADLIVVGSSGLGAHRGSSVSSELPRYSQIPVLVVDEPQG
jgi:nucleotide-binding universal stress UspA family protein